MFNLTNENIKSLEELLELPVVEKTSKNRIIVNCGGCTSLHHNN